MWEVIQKIRNVFGPNLGGSSILEDDILTSLIQVEDGSDCFSETREGNIRTGTN